MITIPGTGSSDIQGVMQGTFKTVLPLVLIIVGLNLAFFILEFIVGKIRDKSEHEKAFHQAQKDMVRLNSYAKQHNLNLTGNYSPDFTQDPGKSEKEYNEMMGLATKYGVKVSSDKNIPLN